MPGLLDGEAVSATSQLAPHEVGPALGGMELGQRQGALEPDGEGGGPAHVGTSELAASSSIRPTSALASAASTAASAPTALLRAGPSASAVSVSAVARGLRPESTSA